MTIKDLCSKIAALEGKKHQASIGDIREIVGIISEAVVYDPNTLVLLTKNGLKRLDAKRRKKR